MLTHSPGVRNRFGWVAVGRLLLLTVLAAGYSSCAHAQGLFEQIFGFIAPKPQAAEPRPLPFKAAPSLGLGAPREASDGNAKGTYRTVCVRMCDGFFVPVSFSTRRDQFNDDQAKCHASCGGEASLFYYPNPGGDLEDAVDLSGRAYGRLPNAFRFRKARVEGCACRPPPWSDVELERHRSYASGVDLEPGKGRTAAARTLAVADVARAEAALGEKAQKSAAKAPGRTDEAVARKAGPSERVQRRLLEARAGQPRVARVQPQPAASENGLFGFATAQGMGLTKKAYVWPGD